jgi:hypothetical protein
MGQIILAEAFAVLLAWAIVAYGIWKFGPGLRDRTVRCPEIKVHATVLADQHESEFGCLRVVDLRACSLIPAAVLSCDKKCMARL